jgi:prepilin-type N-terminal cleavage/methylation domain-containing protein
MSAKSGFTLIELVLVVVIVGILAAIATPRFQTVGDNAKRASILHVAGALESASQTNMMAKKAGKPEFILVNQANACAQNIAESLLSSPLPAGIFVDELGNGEADGADCSGAREFAVCRVSVAELTITDPVTGDVSYEDIHDFVDYKMYCAR